MNIWVRRAVKASLISAGFLVLGAGAAHADDGADPGSLTVGADVSVTVPVIGGRSDAGTSAHLLRARVRVAVGQRAHAAAPKSARVAAEVVVRARAASRAKAHMKSVQGTGALVVLTAAVGVPRVDAANAPAPEAAADLRVRALTVLGGSLPLCPTPADAAAAEPVADVAVAVTGNPGPGSGADPGGAATGSGNGDGGGSASAPGAVAGQPAAAAMMPVVVPLGWFGRGLAGAATGSGALARGSLPVTSGPGLGAWRLSLLLMLLGLSMLVTTRRPGPARPPHAG